ncbi:MAG: PHP domain-containing protein [Chloroflexia bacterium]|nr:PHP domain-containing protein [Chloroflexia bacterium]
MNEFVGTQWFKCDFHLHTPQSRCFKNQEITPEEWIKAAKDKKLDCVAVTDHNAAGWINRIKEVAEKNKITVFPGVELTAGDAKIHLIVLFDPLKDQLYVEDFLIKAGIKKRRLWKPNRSIRKINF